MSDTPTLSAFINAILEHTPALENVLKAITVLRKTKKQQVTEMQKLEQNFSALKADIAGLSMSRGSGGRPTKSIELIRSLDSLLSELRGMDRNVSAMVGQLKAVNQALEEIKERRDRIVKMLYALRAGSPEEHARMAENLYQDKCIAIEDAIFEQEEGLPSSFKWLRSDISEIKDEVLSLKEHLRA
ncbi:hypothetical protein TWF696_007907 [Orbilia brochopaga]|uniref:Uncharacterized protein n=1 Tax=Orbilia brochopaga TaxID=3140254 RepID=A0AAV9UNX7_9PEZI